MSSAVTTAQNPFLLSLTLHPLSIFLLTIYLFPSTLIMMVCVTFQLLNDGQSNSNIVSTHYLVSAISVYAPLCDTNYCLHEAARASGGHTTVSKVSKTPNEHEH